MAHRFKIMGAVEPAVRFVHRVKPPSFDPYDWPGSHIGHDELVEPDTTRPVPRRIFVFWTGENPLTTNRLAGLNALQQVNPGISVELVTPENLDNFLLADHPLHPAYEFLSNIHKSDYLRCYAKHFHGGGYADIKRALHPWSDAFDRLDRSGAWMAGYPVPVRLMTPTHSDRRLEKAMKKFSEARLGQCVYIARPRTPLTAEWWRAMNLKLDESLEQLREHPGDARGENPDYPFLVKTVILAQILDPLEVKYRAHLVYDQRLQPDLDNYI